MTIPLPVTPLPNITYTMNTSATPKPTVTTTSTAPEAGTGTIESSPHSSSGSKDINFGAIIGGVAGGIAGIILLSWLLLMPLRRRNNKRKEEIEWLKFEHNEPEGLGPALGKHHLLDDDQDDEWVVPGSTNGAEGSGHSPVMSQVTNDPSQELLQHTQGYMHPAAGAAGFGIPTHPNGSSWNPQAAYAHLGPLSADGSHAGDLSQQTHNPQTSIPNFYGYLGGPQQQSEPQSIARSISMSTQGPGPSEPRASSPLPMNTANNMSSTEQFNYWPATTSASNHAISSGTAFSHGLSYGHGVPGSELSHGPDGHLPSVSVGHSLSIPRLSDGSGATFGPGPAAIIFEFDQGTNFGAGADAGGGGFLSFPTQAQDAAHRDSVISSGSGDPYDGCVVASPSAVAIPTTATYQHTRRRTSIPHATTHEAEVSPDRPASPTEQAPFAPLHITNQ